MGGRGGSSNINNKVDEGWNRSIDNYSKQKERVDRLNSSTYKGKTQFTANGKTATINHYTNKAGARMYQVTTGKGETKEVDTYYTLAGAKDSVKSKLGLF